MLGPRYSVRLGCRMLHEPVFGRDEHVLPKHGGLREQLGVLFCVLHRGELCRPVSATIKPDPKTVLSRVANAVAERADQIRDRSAEVVRGGLVEESLRFAQTGQLAASFSAIEGRVVSSEPYARIQDVGGEIVANRMLLRDSLGKITARADRVKLRPKGYVSRAVDLSMGEVEEASSEEIVDAMIEGGAKP